MFDKCCRPLFFRNQHPQSQVFAGFSCPSFLHVLLFRDLMQDMSCGFRFTVQRDKQKTKNTSAQAIGGLRGECRKPKSFCTDYMGIWGGGGDTENNNFCTDYRMVGGIQKTQKQKSAQTIGGLGLGLGGGVLFFLLCCWCQSRQSFNLVMLV